MKRLLLAASALFCAGSLAHAATLTATPATVWNVVKGAAPGDVVQFSAGDYGALNLWAIPQAAPGVTVQPAPGAAVKVSTIDADDSSWLTFTGFDVTMTPGTQYGVSTGRGSNLVFDGLKIHQADGSNLVGLGFLVRNATNVTIRNSEVYWVGSGASVVDSTGVSVVGNLIHDINVDGVILTGGDKHLVKGNTIRDLHPGDGDHPDAIQGYDGATKLGSAEIAGNHIERGAGGLMQGVFIAYGAGLWIHDNELLGTMTNGIALAGTRGASIDHNFVAGYPDLGTQIVVRGGCDGVKITNNAAQALVNYAPAGEPPCTNVTMSGNSIIPAVQPGDLAALNAWKGTPIVVSDPAPVVTPPASDPTAAAGPTQADVDALNAKIAALTQQLAAANAASAAAQAQVATLTQQLAAAQSTANATKIATLTRQLTAAQTALAAAQGKIAKAQADLK